MIFHLHRPPPYYPSVIGDRDDMRVRADRRERIANFLAVPLEVEKITLFGALLCLDGFLYNFTVLPLRALFATYRLIMSSLRHQPTITPPSHIHSILRLLLVIIPTGVLLVGTDASKMYHTVRGQDTIKLYVIFNALEVGRKEFDT